MSVITCHLQSNLNNATFVFIDLVNRVNKSAPSLIKLDTFEFLNVIPNIPINATLQFQIGGDIIQTITINAGNYSASQLASTITTLLNDNEYGHVFTVSFSEVTSLFTFSCTEEGTPLTIQLNVSQSTLAAYLGFNITPASANTNVSDSPVNLSGPSHVYVYCNWVNSVYVNEKPTNLIAKVPINLGYSFKNFYTSTLDDWVNGNPQNVLQLAIMDSYGNNINLGNQTWNACIKIKNL